MMMYKAGWLDRQQPSPRDWPTSTKEWGEEVITISKSKLIHGQFANRNGQHCIVGEVLFQSGVDNVTLFNSSYDAMQKKLAPPLREKIFTISSEGYILMRPALKTVTEFNDNDEYEQAASLLNSLGIEVELVD